MQGRFNSYPTKTFGANSWGLAYTIDVHGVKYAMARIVNVMHDRPYIALLKAHMRFEVQQHVLSVVDGEYAYE